MFNKWTSIGGFHNVRKTLNAYDLHDGPITYRGKVKLHGTNAGIVITPDGTVTAQSRTSTLTYNDDNAGFAKWVFVEQLYWADLAGSETVTVYGEWCGPGIQKGTAINKIESKVFAVFAIQYGDAIADDDGQEHAPTIIDPDAIKKILDNSLEGIIEGVMVLPWYGDEIVVDYKDTPSLQAAVAHMNRVVETIEGTDPWVKETFGVDGMGEGIVYYPVSFQFNGILDRWHLSTFMFKAKGEKHKVVKSKQAVQIDPEVAASVDDFVAMVVTDARLEQGAREVAGDLVFEHRHIGPFIKWMGQDIQKETVDELEASGLDWKQVVKPVSVSSRTWYLAKIEEL
jgi:hypothetical protein